VDIVIGVWRRLSDDKMIAWLDDDCESYIIRDLNMDRIGNAVARKELKS